jgi:hypothetical protein
MMMDDEVMRLCTYDLTLILACGRDRYPCLYILKWLKTICLYGL